MPGVSCDSSKKCQGLDAKDNPPVSVGGTQGSYEVWCLFQTRLPSELVSALQGIMADYEADLSLLRTTGSDSEEPEQQGSPEAMQCPLVFPSGQLLEAINGAVKASADASGTLRMCVDHRALSAIKHQKIISM